jgi:hypothetical protein
MAQTLTAMWHLRRKAAASPDCSSISVGSPGRLFEAFAQDAGRSDRARPCKAALDRADRRLQST